MTTEYEARNAEEIEISEEPEFEAGEPRMTAKKKRILIAASAVALILALVFGVRYIIWSLNHEETDDAYVSGHLHPISARVTDTVQQVLINDNQHVVKGQILVVLDPKDFQLRLDQAKAALDVAASQADTAQAAIRSISQSATAQTTQAQGAIGEAKASISAARAEVSAGMSADNCVLFTG